MNALTLPPTSTVLVAIMRTGPSQPSTEVSAAAAPQPAIWKWSAVAAAHHPAIWKWSAVAAANQPAIEKWSAVAAAHPPAIWKWSAVAAAPQPAIWKWSSVTAAPQPAIGEWSLLFKQVRKMHYTVSQSWKKCITLYASQDKKNALHCKPVRIKEYITL